MKEYEMISDTCKMLWMEGYELKDEDVYTQVSAYVFNDDGEMLVVKNEGENTWTIPGGHPEPGETKLESLEREMMEEACIVLKDINYLGAVNVIEPGKDYYQLRYTAHVGELKPFVQEMEISERAWVKPENLKQYITWADGISFKAQVESAVNFWNKKHE